MADKPSDFASNWNSDNWCTNWRFSFSVTGDFHLLSTTTSPATLTFKRHMYVRDLKNYGWFLFPFSTLLLEGKENSVYQNSTRHGVHKDVYWGGNLSLAFLCQHAQCFVNTIKILTFSSFKIQKLLLHLKRTEMSNRDNIHLKKHDTLYGGQDRPSQVSKNWSMYYVHLSL